MVPKLRAEPSIEPEQVDPSVEDIATMSPRQVFIGTFVLLVVFAILIAFIASHAMH